MDQLWKWQLYVNQSVGQDDQPWELLLAGLREGVERKFLNTDGRIVISKVRDSNISKTWMAYRVEMFNGSHRKWTLAMCAIVRQFNDKRYATQHPRGTTGSLYKKTEIEDVIDTSIG